MIFSSLILYSSINFESSKKLDINFFICFNLFSAYSSVGFFTSSLNNNIPLL
ncbi:hypothetical protein KST19_02420 [Fusobacterium animalis]|uniref:hypothetical protein n=1 Tax=Fusobacterium animalis TaxID=76859 RepID=UPI003254DBD2